MSDDLWITTAGPEDIEDLVAIEQAQMDAGEVIALDLDDMRDRLGKARLDTMEHGFVVLARLNGKPVGALTVTFILDYPAGAEKGVVDNAVVIPDQRRRGIARRMLATACHLCRVRGCAIVESIAEKKNKAANALYKALDFEGAQRVRFRKGLH